MIAAGGRAKLAAMMSVWSRGGAALVLILALTAEGEARPHRSRPRPGTELTTAELGWPDGALSARARGQVHVMRSAGGRAKLGKLASGTRVAWKRIVATRDRCRAWLEIEPRGWVCATEVAPSELAPEAGIDPDRVVARVEAKEHAGVVARGAFAYATAVAVAAAKPTKRVAGWTFLRADTPLVKLGARKFYRSRHGYIAAADTEPRTASTFAGVDLLAAPAPWPLGWAIPPRKTDPVIVRAGPRADAAEVGRLARRERVAVLAEQDGFVQIGADRWVARGELRIARTAARPRGVVDGERWIDVDLDEQVLVAYQGDAPVYATLVSSGRNRSTPTAIHRIEEKRVTARMKSPEIARGKWDMPDVPFAMTFREHYAVHGVYWHDSFGKARSQGCLNLSPRDARFLFGWTLPAIPDGWLQGFADHHDGTPIRLRSRRDPDPQWTDFHAPPPVKTKLDADPDDDA